MARITAHMAHSVVHTVAHPLAGAAPAGNAGGASALSRLDPRAKIVALIGFVIVVVTTPADAFLAFALYGVLLSFLVGLARLPLGLLARRWLLLLPFVLFVAVFLPFYGRAGGGSFNLGRAGVSSEGLLVLFNVTAKAFLAVTATTLLFFATGLADLLAGLRDLRVPSVFVLILSFLHRYSFVIGEEARRMRTAMAARNYRARWLWQGAAIAHLIASLFLRSYERAERVHAAMLSRGYTGGDALSSALSFRTRDAAFVAIVLGAALAVRVVVPTFLA